MSLEEDTCHLLHGTLNYLSVCLCVCLHMCESVSVYIHGISSGVAPHRATCQANCPCLPSCRRHARVTEGAKAVRFRRVLGI